MHLSDSGILSDLQLPTIADLTSGLQPAPVPAPGVSSNTATVSSSGDFWNNLLSTVGNIGTAGLQVYGAIKQAQYLNYAGVRPVGYSNGVPIYASTPSGVTPSNPYSLPSGMSLPAGVTPNYSVIPGATTISTSMVNPLANLLSGSTGTYLMYGSLALLAIMMLQKKRRR